jgi:DNA-binding transcriptional ArsR family regulator
MYYAKGASVPEHDLVMIFRALADKTRQGILELLCEDEMNVSDICAEFKTSQPTISHHLQILRNCHLIDSRKQGKKIYYYVKKEVFSEAFGSVIRKMHIEIVEE